jgi:hypothetical protein
VVFLAFPLTFCSSWLHSSQQLKKTDAHSMKHQYKTKVLYGQQHTLKSELDAMFQANECSNNLLDIAKESLMKSKKRKQDFWNSSCTPSETTGSMTVRE